MRCAPELLAAEAESHVLRLRELLVRFDENLKAHQLMESVPYWIAERPAIVRAKREQREMVLHAIDPEAYEVYYRSNPHERPFEQQYPGLTVENAHEHLFRVQFLRDGLTRQLEQHPNPDEFGIIDLTANDGWMLANLKAAGYSDLFGCELNDRAIARANARGFKLYRHDFRQLVRETAESWNAVVLFETLEHLPDPAGALEDIAGIVSMDGRLYISTPDGAVEEGDLPSWSHVERKGHLWAWPVEQFTAMLDEVGEVVNCEIGPDKVAVAEVRPR
jgi:SAM-dependent methyltransferase